MYHSLDLLSRSSAAGYPSRGRMRCAFSLIEMLVAIVVIGILATLVMSGVGEIRYKAREAQSVSNIRQLATANVTYASEHGRFARDMNDGNNRRWFGSRTSGGFSGGAGDIYSNKDGYLSDYLDGGRVRYCPVLEAMYDADSGLRSSFQFDRGAGGYGYNAAYIGNTPEILYGSGDASAMPELGATRPKGGSSQEESNITTSPGNLLHNVEDASRTVMFTSAAIAMGDGLAEYGSSEPFRFLVPGGQLGGSLTPSTHFRFKGRALVAWADGHVTFEMPNTADSGWNVYGGSNAKYKLGWFGPSDNNGFWNPRRAEGTGW